ncbi:MAG: F0F1 ATP synthase subunit A [Ignavibacteriaceae bacterium]
MAGNNYIDTLKVVSDSLENAGKSDSGWILHHVMDGREIELPFLGTLHIPQFPLVFGIDITPSKHVIFMWLAAILALVTFYAVAKGYKGSLIPKRFTNLFEVLIIFVRDEIAEPTIGKAYKTFLPFLLTLFFFILFGNFLGLIPYSSTFTSNRKIRFALFHQIESSQKK